MPTSRSPRRPRPVGTAVTGAVVVALAALGAAGAPPPREPAPSLAPVGFFTPDTPTGVAVVGADGALDVSWTATAESSLKGFRVYLDGSSTVAATAGSAARSVRVPNLVNGRDYQVEVVAYGSYGSSGRTSAVTGRPVDGVPPAAPVGLRAARGDTTVALSWTANGEPDLAGYQVLLDGAVIGQVGLVTSVTVTGLTNDGEYRFALRAVDTSKQPSPTSTEVRATPTDLTAPQTPTGLTGTAGDTTADLRWDGVPDADVASYVLLDEDGAVVATTTAPTTTAHLGGLTNGRTLRLRVAAVDGHGNRSTPSAPVSLTPADTTAPGAPSGVTATPGTRSAHITWQPPADRDVAGYRVLLDGQVVATTDAATTSAGLPGLEEERTYTVTVVAVDTAGNVSPASTPVSVRVPDRTPPAVPTGTTAVAGDASALVGWDAGSGDVASYQVLQDGVVVASVPAETTGTTVTGLTNGTRYTFSVRAVDAAGNVSAASVAVEVTPLAPTPPPPTPPTAPTTVPTTGSGGESGVAASRDGRWVVVGTRASLESDDTNPAYELYRVDTTTGAARRVAPLPPSWRSTSTDSTNSSSVAVSEDGRYVALTTTARLSPADTNSLEDVYRVDLASGAAQLVSVPAAGTVSASVAGTVRQSGASVYSTRPSVAISADGDRVVFYSARADLVPGDRNGAVDVFAKDLGSGQVRRLSTTAAGTDLPRTVAGPALALTPDGRYAVFPAGTSQGPVVLLRKDLATGALETVSTVRTDAGSEVEVGVFRDAGDVAVSDDGRYVALSTAAKVGTTSPGASWPTGLAYRKDMATGALVPLGPGQTSMWEHQVALDPTGRYGFFSTAAAALAQDDNGHTDVYRRDLASGDLASGDLVLVTAAADGSAGPRTGGSVGPAEYGTVLALTAGRAVVVTTQPLLAADTNATRDTYRKDLGSGAVASAVP